jgi:acetoin:2,6-dichlorophenolindophenol oxidoreductase subunit alpha
VSEAELLRQLYGTLTLCRSFESALIRFAGDANAGIPHPYIGQEGVAAGVCVALTEADRVVSPHRMVGHAVARGCDLRRLASELFGRADGLCRGRSGEMYASQYDVGYMGATQIVGGNLPMAAGLALAAKLSGTPSVVVAFVGDGAVNQGAFSEALNLAGVWLLPLVVVVENNGYAEATPAEYAIAGNILTRAAGYGLAAEAVDGQDAVAVHHATSTARDRGCEGQGPTLLEMRTYRYEGHYYGDQHRRYRTESEVARWGERDPLAIHRERMILEGFTEGELDDIEAESASRSEEAVREAVGGAAPVWEDLVDDVFSPSDVADRYHRMYLDRALYA